MTPPPEGVDLLTVRLSREFDEPVDVQFDPLRDPDTVRIRFESGFKCHFSLRSWPSYGVSIDARINELVRRIAERRPRPTPDFSSTIDRISQLNAAINTGIMSWTEALRAMGLDSFDDVLWKKIQSGYEQRVLVSRNHVKAAMLKAWEKDGRGVMDDVLWPDRQKGDESV